METDKYKTTTRVLKRFLALSAQSIASIHPRIIIIVFFTHY